MGLRVLGGSFVVMFQWQLYLADFIASEMLECRFLIKISSQIHMIEFPCISEFEFSLKKIVAPIYLSLNLQAVSGKFSCTASYYDRSRGRRAL